MDTLLDTLEELSDAAAKVLPHLEKYDYHKEAKSDFENHLSLDVLPKPLKEIVNGLLYYCMSMLDRNDNLPSRCLLNKANMQRFINNLNLSGDKSQIQQIQYIDIDPIKGVADCLGEIGLSNQSRQLENVYEFCLALREFKAAKPNGNTRININFTVAKEELNEDEQLQAQIYTDFCTIFKAGSLSSSQKKAIYNSFRQLLADKGQDMPHLVIMAAILLLFTKPAYGKPLKGTLNSIRITVFKSLGLPENTAKAYKKTSLQPNETPTLHKYRQPAEDLLELALGNTR